MVVSALLAALTSTIAVVTLAAPLNLVGEKSTENNRILRHADANLDSTSKQMIGSCQLRVLSGPTGGDTCESLISELVSTGLIQSGVVAPSQVRQSNLPYFPNFDCAAIPSNRIICIVPDMSSLSAPTSGGTTSSNSTGDPNTPPAAPTSDPADPGAGANATTTIAPVTISPVCTKNVTVSANDTCASLAAVSGLMLTELVTLNVNFPSESCAGNSSSVTLPQELVGQMVCVDAPGAKHDILITSTSTSSAVSSTSTSAVSSSSSTDALSSSTSTSDVPETSPVTTSDTPVVTPDPTPVIPDPQQPNPSFGVNPGICTSCQQPQYPGSDVLEAHNYYRAMYNVPDLAYDPRLAAEAHDALYTYQSSGKSRDCGDTDVHDDPYLNDNGLGENLAGVSLKGATFQTSSENEHVVSAVNYWIMEAAAYYGLVNDITGHFTQLIWKSTTHVGCAVRFCNGDTQRMVDCRYHPRGNVGDNPWV